MIGEQVLHKLAPHEYRFAFNAAMPYLASESAMVVCGVPQLAGELHQFLPERGGCGTNFKTAGLWVEPMNWNWRAELKNFSSNLSVNSSLIIIASRPLARIIPERKNWQGRPLGLQPGGFASLIKEAAEAGFKVEMDYGIHTLLSIAINLTGQKLAPFWPDKADQLHFLARSRYKSAGPLRTLSTVGLLIARKTGNGKWR